MPILGDPQGTQARAIDTERKYPSRGAEEPPRSFRRAQLLGLALIVLAPVVVYVVGRWIW